MKCKVCKKNLEDHSKVMLNACLHQGFGIKSSKAHEVIAASRIVVQQAQPGQDKHYLELTLRNGTVIETMDLERSYAEILLGVVYEPGKHKEEHDDAGAEKPEPADRARDVPSHAGDAEEDPVAKVG